MFFPNFLQQTGLIFFFYYYLTIKKDFNILSLIKAEIIDYIFNIYVIFLNITNRLRDTVPIMYYLQQTYFLNINKR